MKENTHTHAHLLIYFHDILKNNQATNWKTLEYEKTISFPPNQKTWKKKNLLPKCVTVVLCKWLIDSSRGVCTRPILYQLSSTHCYGCVQKQTMIKDMIKAADTNSAKLYTLLTYFCVLFVLDRKWWGMGERVKTEVWIASFLSPAMFSSNTNRTLTAAPLTKKKVM